MFTSSLPKHRQPAQFRVLTQVDVTGVVARQGGPDVLIQGTLAYVVGGRGLGIFDLGKLADPVCMCEVESSVLTHEGLCSLAMGDEDILWLVGGNGLAAFDVADPRAPKQLCQAATGVTTGSSGASLIVEGNIAYIAGGDGLAIFEVSDPRDPQRLSKTDPKVTCQNGFSSICLDRDMKRLFFLGNKGLTVFDVVSAMPSRLCTVAAPVVQMPCRSGPGWGEVSCCGDTVFVSGSKGLISFDFGKPTQPVKLCQIRLGMSSSFGCAHVVMNGTMYVVSGTSMAVVDTRDASAMKQLYEGKTGISVWEHKAVERVKVVDDTCYIIGAWGLAVLDISYFTSATLT